MEALAEKVKNVFTDGAYSDLTVACKDRSWKVHKLVVCAQSWFFSKACDSEFLEAKGGRITLVKDDPEVVDAMLHYFYHFNYDDSKGGNIAPILLNLRMAELSEKYFVKPMGALAIQRFSERAQIDWGSDGFAEVLEHVWVTELSAHYVKALKAILIETVRKHHDQLFKEDKYDKFQQAAVSSPGFLFDYTKAMTLGTGDGERPANTRDLGALTWYKCPGTECAKHGAIFAVEKTVPAEQSLSCPLKCTGNHKASYWEAHKTTL